MGCSTQTNIYTISEKSSEMTLFDCRWVPCSARFVVAGTHTKGHGILTVYTLSETEELIQSVTIERKRHPFKCITFGASKLDERYPATGDFDGNINVWDIENKLSVWSAKGHSSIINSIDGAVGKQSTNNQDHLVVTGSRDGSVKVWDIRAKEKAVASMQPLEGNPSHDCWTVAFGSSSDSADKIIAAGFDNGDVKIFDLRAMSVLWETHVSNGVCSLAFDSSTNGVKKLSATCLCGYFYSWNLNSFQSIAKHPEITEKLNKCNHTIWGGRFLHQNRNILLTFDGSGSVKVLNYKSKDNLLDSKKSSLMNSPSCVEKLQETQLSEQPISSFDWSPDKLGLAVSTSFDQKIRVLAVTNLENCDH